MAYPMNPTIRGNANTAEARLYKQKINGTFIDEMENATAMSLYTNMESAAKHTLIYQPIFAKVGTAVSDKVSCLYIRTSSWEVTLESLVIDDRIYELYDYCPEDYERLDKTVESYLEEMDRQIRLNLHYILDKVVFDTAVAAAGTTIPAVTDSITAKAALTTVRDFFTGRVNVQNPLIAIIPSSLNQYFVDLAATRITAFGDQAFITGEVSTIDGIKLVTIQDSQLTDPTLVVFFAGKPVHYYFDKNGMMVEESVAAIPVGKARNTNISRTLELQGNAVVWTGNQERIIVAG